MLVILCFTDAESDAIEAGAEEVTMSDDENTLEFITDARDLINVSNELTKVGYNCHDASISYIPHPHMQTSVNPIEAKSLEKLIGLLMAESCVTAVHSSAA